jgi:hypothetical protein
MPNHISELFDRDFIETPWAIEGSCVPLTGASYRSPARSLLPNPSLAQG